jgi:homoserine O-acetyltransferase
VLIMGIEEAAGAELFSEFLVPEAFAGTETKFLVISFSSDWLFPSFQSKEIVSALRKSNGYVIYTEIQTDYGHDAFLLESEQLGKLITNFLEHGSNAP